MAFRPPTRRLLHLRLRTPHTPQPSSPALLPRLYSSSSSSSTFQPGPSPPRLPPDQQAEFERLQRSSAERLGILPEASPSTPATDTSRHATTPTSSPASADKTAAAAASHTGVWRGAPPEFEGDTNPRTGEVGGPKNEPLRWGGQGDWSYNGRVTDF